MIFYIGCIPQKTEKGIVYTFRLSIGKKDKILPWLIDEKDNLTEKQFKEGVVRVLEIFIDFLKDGTT